MLTLIKHLLQAFLYDELAARRWARGFLFWLFGIAVQIVTAVTAPGQAAGAGIDVILSWTWKEWLVRLALAAVAGTGGAINLGQMNPKEEAKP